MTLPPIIAWLQGQEIMLIFVLVLLLFGAKKLPEFARGLGKSMGEFKKARSEFESEISRASIEEPVTRPQALPPAQAQPVVTQPHVQPVEQKFG